MLMYMKISPKTFWHLSETLLHCHIKLMLTCIMTYLCLTLHYRVVPIQEKSYVFGDNKTMLESGTRPQYKLQKCHTALSFHRVREAIAAKIIGFYHISGEINPADILSKRWGYTQVWTMLQPCCFGKVIPYQFVIRMERAELQHLHQMGSDRIFILIIVTNREFMESYEKEFLDSYNISAKTL